MERVQPRARRLYLNARRRRRSQLRYLALYASFVIAAALAILVIGGLR